MLTSSTSSSSSSKEGYRWAACWKGLSPKASPMFISASVRISSPSEELAVLWPPLCGAPQSQDAGLCSCKFNTEHSQSLDSKACGAHDWSRHVLQRHVIRALPVWSHCIGRPEWNQSRMLCCQSARACAWRLAEGKSESCRLSRLFCCIQAEIGF